MSTRPWREMREKLNPERRARLDAATEAAVKAAVKHTLVWNLDEALELIAVVEARLRPRYHVALTGSVLLMGASTKDLDLIVYPTTTADQDLAFVESAFGATGLVRKHDREVVVAKWRRQGSEDEKHVEVWEYQGKRVDVFFLK